MRARTTRAGLGRWALVAFGVLLVLLAGIVIGRSQPTARPQVRTPEANNPGAIRSQAGAVAATAEWLDAVDTRQELLDGPRLRNSISRLVARGAQEEMARRLAAAAVQLRGRGVPPAPTVRSAPVGYRVVSFSAERTTVATWEVVTRSALDVAPSVLWARSQLTLVWEGRWKVSASRVRVNQLDELTPSDMATMDEQYASFHHAPYRSSSGRAAAPLIDWIGNGP